MSQGHQGKGDRILVVGAGVSGATIARRFAEENISVEVIEKRTHLAGNTFDYLDDHGWRVSLYGPHIFHTRSDRVWAWVNRFSPWTPYEHRVKSFIREGLVVPVPTNLDTINEIFGLSLQTESDVQSWLDTETAPYRTGLPPKNSRESCLQRMGPRLYSLMIEGYTKKQWDRDASELDPQVLARIPVRSNRDDRYFSDPHQALPTNGYTAFVTEMLRHPLISVKTEIDYLQCPAAMKQSYSRTFYTGPIDAYFAALGLEELQYRSLRFETETPQLPEGLGSTVWPAAVVNFPSASVPWTRLTEYCHFPNQDEAAPKSGLSTIIKEYSQAHGDPYYPVPNPRNHELYAKYRSHAEREERSQQIHFVGRLANYKYYNMDEAILAALQMADTILD